MDTVYDSVRYSYDQAISNFVPMLLKNTPRDTTGDEIDEGKKRATATDRVLSKMKGNYNKSMGAGLSSLKDDKGVRNVSNSDNPEAIMNNMMDALTVELEVGKYKSTGIKRVAPELSEKLRSILINPKNDAKLPSLFIKDRNALVFDFPDKPLMKNRKIFGVNTDDKQDPRNMRNFAFDGILPDSMDERFEAEFDASYDGTNLIDSLDMKYSVSERRNEKTKKIIVGPQYAESECSIYTVYLPITLGLARSGQFYNTYQFPMSDDPILEKFMTVSNAYGIGATYSNLPFAQSLFPQNYYRFLQTVHPEFWPYVDMVDDYVAKEEIERTRVYPNEIRDYAKKYHDSIYSSWKAGLLNPVPNSSIHTGFFPDAMKSLSRKRSTENYWTATGFTNHISDFGLYNMWYNSGDVRGGHYNYINRSVDDVTRMAAHLELHWLTNMWQHFKVAYSYRVFHNTGEAYLVQIDLNEPAPSSFKSRGLYAKANMTIEDYVKFNGPKSGQKLSYDKWPEENFHFKLDTMIKGAEFGSKYQDPNQSNQYGWANPLRHFAGFKKGTTKIKFLKGIPANQIARDNSWKTGNNQREYEKFGKDFVPKYLGPTSLLSDKSALDKFYNLDGASGRTNHHSGLIKLENTSDLWQGTGDRYTIPTDAKHWPNVAGWKSAYKWLTENAFGKKLLLDMNESYVLDSKKKNVSVRKDDIPKTGDIMSILDIGADPLKAFRSLPPGLFDGNPQDLFSYSKKNPGFISVTSRQEYEVSKKVPTAVQTYVNRNNKALLKGVPTRTESEIAKGWKNIPLSELVSEKRKSHLARLSTRRPQFVDNAYAYIFGNMIAEKWSKRFAKDPKTGQAGLPPSLIDEIREFYSKNSGTAKTKYDNIRDDFVRLIALEASLSPFFAEYDTLNAKEFFGRSDTSPNEDSAIKMLNLNPPLTPLQRQCGIDIDLMRFGEIKRKVREDYRSAMKCMTDDFESGELEFFMSVSTVRILIRLYVVEAIISGIFVFSKFSFKEGNIDHSLINYITKNILEVIRTEAEAMYPGVSAKREKLKQLEEDLTTTAGSTEKIRQLGALQRELEEKDFYTTFLEIVGKLYIEEFLDNHIPDTLNCISALEQIVERQISLASQRLKELIYDKRALDAKSFESYEVFMDEIIEVAEPPMTDDSYGKLAQVLGKKRFVDAARFDRIDGSGEISYWQKLRGVYPGTKTEANPRSAAYDEGGFVLEKYVKPIWKNNYVKPSEKVLHGYVNLDAFGNHLKKFSFSGQTLSDVFDDLHFGLRLSYRSISDKYAWDQVTRKFGKSDEEVVLWKKVQAELRKQGYLDDPEATGKITDRSMFYDEKSWIEAGTYRSKQDFVLVQQYQKYEQVFKPRDEHRHGDGKVYSTWNIPKEVLEKEDNNKTSIDNEQSLRIDIEMVVNWIPEEQVGDMTSRLKRDLKRGVWNEKNLATAAQMKSVAQVHASSLNEAIGIKVSWKSYGGNPPRPLVSLYPDLVTSNPKWMSWDTFRKKPWAPRKNAKGEFFSTGLAGYVEFLKLFHELDGAGAITEGDGNDSLNLGDWKDFVTRGLRGEGGMASADITSYSGFVSLTPLIEINQKVDLTEKFERFRKSFTTSTEGVYERIQPENCEPGEIIQAKELKAATTTTTVDYHFRREYDECYYPSLKERMMKQSEFSLLFRHMFPVDKSVSLISLYNIFHLKSTTNVGTMFNSVKNNLMDLMETLGETKDFDKKSRWEQLGGDTGTFNINHRAQGIDPDAAMANRFIDVAFIAAMAPVHMLKCMIENFDPNIAPSKAVADLANGYKKAVIAAAQPFIQMGEMATAMGKPLAGNDAAVFAAADWLIQLAKDMENIPDLPVAVPSVVFAIMGVLPTPLGFAYLALETFLPADIIDKIRNNAKLKEKIAAETTFSFDAGEQFANRLQALCEAEESGTDHTKVVKTHLYTTGGEFVKLDSNSSDYVGFYHKHDFDAEGNEKYMTGPTHNENSVVIKKK